MKSKIYLRLTMVFTTILMFTYAATSQTTITVTITDGTYDTEERLTDQGGETVGSSDLGSSDLELGFDSEPQLVGLIFQDVQIPVGATVTNAYVQFTVDAIEAGVTDLELTMTVYGALEANVIGPFTEDPFPVSSYDTTTKVTWSPGPSVAEGDAGVNEQTPDISAVINEIIALDGWAAGNNIMIAVSCDPLQTVDIHREVESADGATKDHAGVGAPALNVTFTEGATSDNAIRAEFSNLIYPNPTDGKLNIINPSTDKFSYEIYTINGKLVARRHDITGSTIEVDLSNFEKGTYFIDVRTTEKKETHKLILK